MWESYPIRNTFGKNRAAWESYLTQRQRPATRQAPCAEEALRRKGTRRGGCPYKEKGEDAALGRASLQGPERASKPPQSKDGSQLEGGEFGWFGNFLGAVASD